MLEQTKEKKSVQNFFFFIYNQPSKFSSQTRCNAPFGGIIFFLSSKSSKTLSHTGTFSSHATGRIAGVRTTGIARVLIVLPLVNCLQVGAKSAAKQLFLYFKKEKFIQIPALNFKAFEKQVYSTVGYKKTFSTINQVFLKHFVVF